jgi:crotonobetainyl-CoA:carnitine CoA-transferase CaiB-like acyl-CoA transferase
VIDASLIESLLQITGPISAAFDKLGVVPGPTASRLPYVAPRGVFRCSDGQWIAISGSAQSIVARLFKAIDQPELVEDPRFVTNERRLEHVEELDGFIQNWIGDRPLTEVMDIFERHEVAAAPVYDIRMILEDEQYQERNTLVRVPDEDLGSILLPDVQPRLSVSPGEIRHAGGKHGSANEGVYAELGMTAEDLVRLRDEGVI